VTVALDIPAIPLTRLDSQPARRSRVNIRWLLSIGGLDRIFSARWTAISLQMRFFGKIGAVLSRLEMPFLVFGPRVKGGEVLLCALGLTC
jgi:hypothetical protein